MSEQEQKSPEEEKADVKAQAQEKADQVKAQAKAKVDEAKAQAQTKAQELQQKLPEQARDKPLVPVAVGIGVGLVALWLIRRR